jgi:hypothetical protein
MRISMAVAALLSLGVAARAGHEGKVEWVKDPELGLKRIKSDKKAGILFFTADW